MTSRIRPTITALLLAALLVGPAVHSASATSNSDKNKGNEQGNEQSNDDNNDENNDDKKNNDDKENKNEDKKRGQAARRLAKEAENQRKEIERRLKRLCATPWSPASSGRPAGLRKGAAAGLYVWHDGSRWNVEATHPGTQTMVFQGVIAFDAPVKVEERHLERGSDSFQSSGHQVSFTFQNHGGVDALRVRSECATSITVSGTINGQPLAPQQFFVGRNASPATASPFVEVRSITVPRITTPAVTAPPVTVTTVPPCTVAPWNTAYLGKPSNLREGAAAGLYVWFDGDRLNLQTTRPNSTPSVIAGSIIVNSIVTAVRGRSNDPGDIVSAQTNGATFSFTNTGGIDGLELRSPCGTQVTIVATIDGQPLVAQQVWIGRDAITSGTVPVTLVR